MIPRIALLTIALFCLICSSAAQEPSKSPGQMAIEHYRQGEEALLNHQYRRAARSFEKSLQLQPDMAAAHRAAGACYELLYEYEKAIVHYEQVIELDSTFSRVLYYLTADANYKAGNYQRALDYFFLFQSLQEREATGFGLNGVKEVVIEKKYLQKLAGNIKACQVAMDSIKFINITEIINLGPRINTHAEEYFPFLSNDQELIFYNRKKGPKKDEDLFYSTFRRGEWESGKPVANFNTSENEGMCTMVRDGRTMFFTACKREGVRGTCDIWQARVDETEILSISKLLGHSNSERWDSEAAVSCDGNTLFFASNREAGYGGADLWYSNKFSDGSWSEPVNLGPKINTAEDEESPFITNDGNTLYFSSTGHPGMGEQDLFMCWKDQSGRWSAPINLGPPVNTAYRELGFFLSADGKTGYFASNRPGGFGNMDIYKFQLSEQLYSDPITFVEGFVRDSILDIPLQARVQINGRAAIQTGKDGRFFLCVRADDILDIKVELKHYKSFARQFVIPEWENKTFYTIELPLKPTLSFIPSPRADTEEDILIREKPLITKQHSHIVLFEFDKSILDAEEIGHMDEFLQPLREKEISRVEVIGFADDIGADLYNLKLSEKRAKKIALFLMENGVLVDKIYLQGRGEIKDDQPKKKNRKVEIKIYTQE